jgi:hypothetical protein
VVQVHRRHTLAHGCPFDLIYFLDVHSNGLITLATGMVPFRGPSERVSEYCPIRIHSLRTSGFSGKSTFSFMSLIPRSYHCPPVADSSCFKCTFTLQHTPNHRSLILTLPRIGAVPQSDDAEEQMYKMTNYLTEMTDIITSSMPNAPWGLYSGYAE